MTFSSQSLVASIKHASGTPTKKMLIGDTTQRKLELALCADETVKMILIVSPLNVVVNIVPGGKTANVMIIRI